MSKIFIIGGPGNISRGTLDYLKEHNCKIAIYTRNSHIKRKRYPEISFYEGDRCNKEALKKAIFDYNAELIIDTICFEPQEAIDLYNIVRGKIQHLIFLSTVDVYGYPLSRLPFQEQDEFRPAFGSYAQKKRTIELFYMEKFEKEGFPITIGRPSLSIGPDFCPMMLYDWGFKTIPKMKNNMPILVPGDGKDLMHVGWGYDVGRMIGRMIGDQKAIGQGYTLSDENYITRDDYISLYTEYLGVSPERVYVPQEYIDRFPGMENVDVIRHLYKENMAFSLEKFKQDFNDYRWIPLKNGVHEFIEVNIKKEIFNNHIQSNIEDLIIKQWKMRF